MTLSSASLQLSEARRVWLPNLGQHLGVEREHRNAEAGFAIAVREHSDTRNDEDVNDRHIVGHLPREYFLLHGGVLGCEVTGRRLCSPLQQGELGIPFQVTQRWKEEICC